MSELDYLQVYHFDNKYRLGVKSDGGYVLAKLEGEYDCYISAGISTEESFSRDFISEYKMNKTNCFGFDGTINDYPYHYTKNITFIKKNIGPTNDDKHDNLCELIDKYDNIFLKMDIEGGEYGWLLNLEESKLKKFKQIVIEFHGITNDGWGCKYEDKYKCLRKLFSTHYIVHAHGNNHGPVNNKIPDVIELTYINKSYFKEEPALNIVPLPVPNLDYPNHPGRRDIDLNCYPFIKK